ncbi:MAG: alpha/beta fold hydrolase [Verrucomicrobia bacterium]|nr:alpha/beta fold hydrolase [Verrucomicrobiota bacterium]
MPLVEPSTFRPPWWLRNAHAQTCWPTLFRRAPVLSPEVLEIPTPDDDFLELDLHRAQPQPRPTHAHLPERRVLILSHGLEGSARSKYNLGLAAAATTQGWDVVARNYRGCGSRLNRAFRLYHSGETDDLRTVVEWAAQRWEHIALSGVSAGGNQTLRYLGQPGVSPAVRRAVVFSVPCDLGSSSIRLKAASNRVYLFRFLRSLRRKIRLKDGQFPGRLNLADLARTRDFIEFDDRYTAPMFGFAGAQGYYDTASSRPYLPQIRVPTLLITAADDPFLTPECYPYDVAQTNPAFHLEVTRWGGHVGFRDATGKYWSERRALEWLAG